MTVADLLEALLLESANDAAVTLARGVSGTTARFVDAMNRRAARSGSTTRATRTPLGSTLRAGTRPRATSRRWPPSLMRDRRFAGIVDRPAARLRSGARPRVVENRNSLIGRYPFVTGVKTGHTMRAGYVLVGAAGKRTGGRVVSVVLGEPSEAARDADTLALLRWGLSRFRRVQALRRGRPVADAAIAHRDERAELVPRRALSVTVRAGQRVRRRIVAPGRLDGPLAEGTRVGSIRLLVDGREVGRAALVTAADVPGAGTVRIVLSTLGVPLTLLLVLGILLAAALAALRIRVRLRLVR